MFMDIILIRKYLCGKNRFVPKTSHLLSLLGIIIGVTALLIVSSVMNGFQEDMMRRIIGSKAEIRILSEARTPLLNFENLIDEILEHPAFLAVSPVINEELIAYRGEAVSVINSFGIDYQRHNELIALDEQIRLGKPDPEEFEDVGIIIGLDLSLALNVTVGEYIQLSSPINKVPTPFGLLPRTKRLKVLGIFVSGMPEFDKTYAYISLNNSRFFSDMEKGVSVLQVKTVKPQQAARYASFLQRQLGKDYLVEDWSQFDASLFQAMQLEKAVMFSVLALMLIISGFNMAGDSLKAVAEKKKEIGVLKALGMKNSRISGFFIGLNIYLGIIGIVIGVTVSSIFLYLQTQYQIIHIPVPGFPMQWLPVSVKVLDFIAVSFIVLIICLLATLIALYKIKEIEPIRIIREQE